MAATIYVIGPPAELLNQLRRWSASEGLLCVGLPDETGLWPRYQPDDAVTVILFAENGEVPPSITSVQQRAPGLDVIVIAAQPSTKFTVGCMQAGAANVVDLGSDLADLFSAIQTAHQHFSEHRQRAEHRQSAQTRMQRLTDGERAVLELMLSGEPNKLIAKRLDVSQRTVEARRARIFNKMEATSLAQLVRLVTEFIQGEPAPSWLRVDPPQPTDKLPPDAHS
jgi:FixJ family two-component response regulator